MCQHVTFINFTENVTSVDLFSGQLRSMNSDDLSCLFFGFWQFLSHFATLILSLTHIWFYDMFHWVIRGHGVIKGEPKSKTSDNLTLHF